MTNSVASETLEISTESDTARMGGLSRITRSKSLASFWIIAPKRGEPIMSGLNRDDWPTAMTVSGSWSNVCKAVPIIELPWMTSTTPFDSCRLNRFDTEELRISRSTRTVRRPAIAAEVANAAATVDLPSPGTDEVTWMTRGAIGVELRNPARNERSDSAKRDNGFTRRYS